MLKIFKPKKSEYSIIIDLINESDKQYFEIFDKKEQKLHNIGDWLVQDLIDKNIFILKSDKKIIWYLDYDVRDWNKIWLKNFFIKNNFKNKWKWSLFLKLFFKFLDKEWFIQIALETDKKAYWANNFYIKNWFKLVNEIKLKYKISKQYSLKIFPPPENKNIYFYDIN